MVALSETGDVYAWGSGVCGQLGHGQLRNETMPCKIESLPEKDKERVTQVDAGWSFTALLTDKGNVYTFGWGDSGRLGHGDTGNQALPHLVDGLAKWRVSTIRSIACGYGHCLAVTDFGDVLTWGSGAYGELGHGQGDSGTSVLWGVPRVVEALQGLDIIAVDGGAHHSAAVTAEGELYTWGDGSEGQLGRTTPGNSRFDGVPRAVTEGNLPKVAAASCGFTHTLILGVGGEAYGCGSNLSNQLGIPENLQNHPIPVMISCFEGVKVKQLNAGREHSLALTSKHEVVAFGCGLSGQLGVGADNSDYACHGGPVKVDQVSGAQLQPLQVVCAGDYSGCVTGK